MHTAKQLEKFAELALEFCPEPVQVMPPEAAKQRLPLAVSVAIDSVLVALLLGGLMAMPAWILSMLS